MAITEDDIRAQRAEELRTGYPALLTLPMLARFLRGNDAITSAPSDSTVARAVKCGTVKTVPMGKRRAVTHAEALRIAEEGLVIIEDDA